MATGELTEETQSIELKNLENSKSEYSTPPQTPNDEHETTTTTTTTKTIDLPAQTATDSTQTMNHINNSTAMAITNIILPEDSSTRIMHKVPDDAFAAKSSSHFVAGLPTASRQIFQEAAAAHGAKDSTNFMLAELSSLASTQLPIQRVRSASSTLDANISISRHPSTSGKHEKKIGHRRVNEGGEVTYKKIQSTQIMGSIQLGIEHTVGSLASKPKRDLLMNDFWEVESINFPHDGSPITPAHHYNDFRFKVYAPIAFRYFRDLFGIAPDDFLMSLCANPLRELSNPGASGSIFYLTTDDEFIIKTVQKKECEFLQKLLPGYYMNLSQNPRTLLPKFFGLWCFTYNSKNVRLVAMNNLLPSDIKMHAKYDLKGSTFGRKASKSERQKASPTFKDLDFRDHHPNGIYLEPDKYTALMNTIKRDCMVLESFQIMDYSLLVGIHNLDLAAKERREERIRNARAKLQRSETINEANTAEADVTVTAATAGTADAMSEQAGTSGAALKAAGSALSRTRSINRQRLVAHSTAMESITADMAAPIEEDEDVPAGGIPARSHDNERLLIYLGIIDILQSYRLEKKLEHTFKSILYNGDTVSVCRPSFYAQRFQTFMGKEVFKKTPSFFKHSPSKRKVSQGNIRTPQRTPSQSFSVGPASRQNTLLSGMSTPPPAFDDISEEDITGDNTSQTQTRQSRSSSRAYAPQQSRISSNRSVRSNTTDDYSDDEIASTSGVRSAIRARSPRLTKTNVQVTSIGILQENNVTQPTKATAAENAIENDVTDGNEIINSTETTTVVKAVQSQTYTSTLVLPDVTR